MTVSACSACALVLLLASAPAGAAGISVPANARFDLGGGGLALAAQDAQIDGSLSLGNGFVSGLGSLHLGSAAQADLGSGLIELSRDWDNQGNVVAGSSLVRFVDDGGDSALLGSTAFASASFVSATGKRYHFESGLTQIVSGALTIQGTSAPIQIDVTQPGATAFLNLLASGTQDIANVGVSDVYATGQPLAPTLTNQGGRGNAVGWFGQGSGGPPAVAVPTPALSPVGLILFALALLGLALRARRRLSVSGASS